MTDTLIHGHALFRQQYFHAREFLKQLATEKQKPKALYIGCCDSRGGDLKHWLLGVEPAVKLAKNSGLQGQALARKAAEENVLQALENLITYDVVRQRLDAGTVHLHAWVYDLDDGHLHVFEPQSDRFVDALQL